MHPISILEFSIIKTLKESETFALSFFRALIVGVVSLSELRILEIWFSTLFFLHALINWAEIWNIFEIYDFRFINCRSSSSVVILHHFFLGVILLFELKLLKIIYVVFSSFLLHALTYWAEILHITFIL